MTEADERRRILLMLCAYHGVGVVQLGALLGSFSLAVHIAQGTVALDEESLFDLVQLIGFQVSAIEPTRDLVRRLDRAAAASGERDQGIE